MGRSFRKFESRLEEVGLLSRIQTRAFKMHVSLRELYDGPRTLSTVAARRDVYSWLSERGKSINEIARLFDRAPSGILKMTRKK